MKKRIKKILKPSTLDTIKAMRRGGREAEMELLGPGFHSHNRVHKSEKIYTRKNVNMTYVEFKNEIKEFLYEAKNIF